MGRLIVIIGIIMLMLGLIGIFLSVSMPPILGRSTGEIQPCLPENFPAPGGEEFSRPSERENIQPCDTDTNPIPGNGLRLPIMGFVPRLEFVILSFVGVFLTIVGLFIIRREEPLPLISSAPHYSPPYMAGTPPRSDDLAFKLRQLDESYRANLISQPEYERLRQQILDSIR
jgi:hypothetical protein